MTEDNFFNLLKRTFPQMLAAISGTLFAISDGMTYGWSAPYIPYLISEISHIETNIHEAELLETCFLMGSFCGLPLTIYLVDKIGRKKSLLLASFVVLLAWIAIGVATNMIYLFVARFFCGMCGNMAFVAAPCYIAEIADSKIRGFLSSIIYVMMLLGCLIVYSVGPYLPFYVPCIIGGSVAIVELLVFSRMPESPLYLLSKNKPEEALDSIKFFKPYCDADKELQEISELLENQLKDKGRFVDIFTVSSNRKGLIIMTVLNAGQHLCAYSVILMNLHTILDAAGTNYMDSAHAAILFAALMLISTIFASTQMDNYGRKALLIFSSILTGICLLCVAVYFNLQHMGYNMLTFSWVPIVSVMVYALVFKIGVGIVPIVVTAEIFPTNLKALGMTLSDSMFIIGGIIAINFYQAVANDFGIHIPFYVFGCFSLFVTFFTIFFIPETKGKTLEEIQILLKGEKPKSVIETPTA
ncbi:unnamed protein product [Psylliodes chrysocephalus]|uniref:Major facilitator superfamily (MFS) profile domain-containing protein n=1 Tax=Psylliodes chrysocephalus TaxID=3402493 RepID=A0A9P0G9D2_9CUCU|nr:unnamed protein product [Psylliodes chrysocephala]